MNALSQAFHVYNQAAKNYSQPTLFGQIKEGCDFKFDGRVWTRGGEGARRFNGAGETVGIDKIPSDQEVMVCAD